MRVFLGDLWAWWLATWRGLSGPAVARPADDAVHLAVTRDGLSLNAGPDGGERTFPAGELAAQLRAMRGADGAPVRGIALVFEADGHVHRQLSRLALPQSRRRAMSTFDLSGATPFRAEDVHLLQTEAVGRIDPGTSYAIVKRDVLDTILLAARNSGVRIIQLMFRAQEGTYALSRTETGRVLAPERARLRRFAGSAAIAATILGATGTLVHAHMAYATARRTAEASVAALSADAKAVRRLLYQRAARVAEVSALRGRIASTLPMAAIWEELARVLPDSAYLTDLSVKDGKVSIAGYSKAASAIIVALEGSPHFETAEFASPVVKVPGRDGERFAVDLRIAEGRK